MDENEVRRLAEEAIGKLKQLLYKHEEDGGYEVEERGDALHINFEEPPGVFVISPNGAARQIWISALSTSFKLDATKGGFVLAKTGEDLVRLVERLVREQTGRADFRL